MNKYVVAVREISERKFIVEAESVHDAIVIIEGKYEDGKIQLDYDDCLEYQILSDGLATETELQIYERIGEQE